MTVDWPAILALVLAKGPATPDRVDRGVIAVLAGLVEMTLLLPLPASSPTPAPARDRRPETWPFRDPEEPR